MHFLNESDLRVYFSYHLVLNTRNIIVATKKKLEISGILKRKDKLTVTPSNLVLESNLTN